MLDELNKIKDSATLELQGISDLKALDDWRVAYMGRKGKLTQVLRGLSDLPIDQRKAVGSAANDIKTLLEAELKGRQQAVKDAKLAGGLDAIDVTLPGRPVSLGRLHPTTQMVREICDAFSAMGFEVVEGPEVESDYYNFEALNIPKDHPARDMWDTIWINRDQTIPTLLRTHTSPMQVRVMEQRQPPVRVVVPGRCYRYEATDATHESVFFQIEGLAVDKGITFADLKGSLFEFAKRLFGAERKVRFRCDYFPFVEPGVDMSIDCFVCGGKGCRLCSNTGWIEILGAGMVHPNVLKGVGYDPEVYTGFAFGLGVERILMLKHGIDDIRHFYANDLRFLKQF
ncbi:MAG: phenylalanine--tRNA ligase subunit alpha [Chloroflexi bacterium]|nr:phenylalanine--tRNA ligase subunit alpha [Chloroflexota bacterium]MBT7081516.1 phenylalanine--tRNA ligase subunit alpha [Chloroflexota bacterium]MBT7289003.1 phenylalanine--tRNA ligase subunit alpha [Chloroflexota bacterium]